jgi:hypothetical protein
MEPGERYWMVVEPYWEAVDIYNGEEEFLRTFAPLPEPAKHLLAAHWCQSEVCNGGFHQFFTNPTGVLAPEAAQGFEAIGMPVVAALVAEAMVTFGAPYPREQEQREQHLSSIPGESRAEWDPFTALDAAFYSEIGEEGALLYRAAPEYALRVTS